MEMLTVVALIGLMTGLGSLSLRGNAGAVQLGAAGTQCANLLESARTTAILRKTPVAVAFLPASATSPAALTALEYRADSGTWSRISQWEKLATGVVLDPSTNPDFNSALRQNSPTVSPALPSLNYAGATFAPGGADGYSYLVFLPTGALHQTHSHPGSLRLVEGVVTGEAIRYTGPIENYFEVVINPSTGRLKLNQPESK